LEEWYWYLGKDIVDRFYPDRLVNHDAIDPNLLNFGTDSMGNVVQCNRLLAEADIPIIVGHCAGNPYGGFSGGYKMLVTGHSGWQSIASHHNPDTMHREDWLGASTESHMRTQFASIGRAIEDNIGKKVFAVDAVIGQESQILAIEAGTIEEVEKTTWPVAKKRTHVRLDMERPADILIIGVPRNFHYGPGMGTNPILLSLAIAGQLSRCWHALQKNPIVIASSICDGWFNESWFPSYRETYHALQEHATAEDFLASSEAVRIATDPDYCFKYTNDYTYHPFHAMSMISGGAVTQKRAIASFIVGAKTPKFARGMGFIPVKSIEEALVIASRYVGADPQILCTPDVFSSGVPVHLSAGQ
jgi:hypothetical protein